VPSTKGNPNQIQGKSSNPKPKPVAQVLLLHTAVVDVLGVLSSWYGVGGFGLSHATAQQVTCIRCYTSECSANPDQ